MKKAELHDQTGALVSRLKQLEKRVALLETSLFLTDAMLEQMCEQMTDMQDAWRPCPVTYTVKAGSMTGNWTVTCGGTDAAK